jgi:hypothetical protein
MCAYLASLTGLVKVVNVDLSLVGGSFSIPAGTYDFGPNTTINGLSVQYTLDVGGAGAVVWTTPARAWTGELLFTSTQATPLSTVAGGGTVDFGDFVSVDTSGSAAPGALINDVDGATWQVNVDGGATLLGNSTVGQEMFHATVSLIARGAADINGINLQPGIAPLAPTGSITAVAIQISGGSAVTDSSYFPLTTVVPGGCCVDAGGPTDPNTAGLINGGAGAMFSTAVGLGNIGASVWVAQGGLGGSGPGTWYAVPATQAGTSTLTNGVSAAPIPAVITGNSRFFAFHKALNGTVTIGTLIVKPTDVVAGAPGSFKVTSITGNTTAATDQSDFDWQILN